MQKLIQHAHKEWQPLLLEALKSMDESYLASIRSSSNCLPAYDRILASFSGISLQKTRYILLGESPYPREESANGYAFYDKAVGSLWSETGFSKALNRATSLRNMLKMLLVARGDLSTDLSQQAIAALDKRYYCQTIDQLFHNFMDHGFLLLNASLIFEEKAVAFHAKAWRPFLQSLLKQLQVLKPQITLLLFGRIAEKVQETKAFPSLVAPHPYNLSFINHPEVLQFFQPLDLLRCSS